MLNVYTIAAIERPKGLSPMSIIQVVDFKAEDAGQQFTNSLRNIGFAVLKDHPIDFALIDAVYNGWQAYFKTEAKYEFPYDPIQNIGYVGPEKSEFAKGYDIKDFKEFFHYRVGHVCPEHLLEDTHKLFTHLLDVAHTLTQWLEANIPAEIVAKFSKPLWEMIDGSPENVLRILHYPPLTGGERPGTFRAAAHEDIDMLTLLTAASGSGLEVYHRETDTWHDVPVRKDWIVVNVGDALQEITGGYLPATTHRVRMPEGDDAKESRLSMPLFCQPYLDTKLSDRYTYGSYRDERFRENGLLEEQE